jgi:hypothetical protein
MEQRWSLYLTNPKYFVHYKMILRGAAAVMVVSEFHRDYLVGLCGLSADRVFIVPMYHKGGLSHHVEDEDTKSLSKCSSDDYCSANSRGPIGDHDKKGESRCDSELEVGSNKKVAEEDTVSKETDVFFFGSSSPRRRRFAYAIGRRGEAEGMKLHIRSIGWDMALFGEKR